MVAAPRFARRAPVFAVQCLRPSFVGGLVYTFLVRWRFRRCGHGVRLPLSSTIRGFRNISLGNNFSSMGQLYLYAEGASSIEIGNYCSINTNVQLGATPGHIVVG